VKWGEFKEETQNNIIDLRSTLIINDMLMSENVIVAEASKPTGITHVAANFGGVALFKAFGKIKKLNGNLFHFGNCTKVAHNSENKVVDLLRDSTIYVSIYLRVMFVRPPERTVIFFLKHSLCCLGSLRSNLAHGMKLSICLTLVVSSSSVVSVKSSH